MVAFANGDIRLVHKAADGATILYASEWIPYDILGNSASPRVFFNAPKRATTSDQNYDFFGLISGPKREMLDVEILHTAQMTPVTASHVVQIAIRRFLYVGSSKIARPDLLKIANRVTVNTAGTRTSSQGWPDNTASVPNVASVMARFIPEAHENIGLEGQARVVLDGA